MSVLNDWARTKRQQFIRVCENAPHAENYPAACFGVAGALACCVILFTHGDYVDAAGGLIIPSLVARKLIQALNNG